MPKLIQVEVRSVSLKDADRVDQDDLRRLTPQERLEAMEALRKAYYGYDKHPPGLDRVLESTSLGEHKVSSDWASGRKKDLVDVALLEGAEARNDD